MERIAAGGTIGFLFGILAGSLVQVGWAGVVLPALLGLVFLILRLKKQQTAYLFAAVFLGAAALGLVRVALVPTTLPSSLQPLIGTEVNLEGVIIIDPDVRETSQRITVEVSRDGAATRVLAVTPLFPVFSYGEQVRVSGLLEKPEPFDEESGRVFLYDKFLAKDGVFSIMHRAHAEVLGPRSGVFTIVFGALLDAKHTFMHALEAALPEPESSLASGILVGGKQGLGTDLLDDFTTTGLLQIVVLSGFNVMIVAEAVRKIFRFLPSRVSLGVAGISVALFVLAAGAGSSAVRAGIMALIGLYARATGRKYDALRALAVAVVIMLFLSPLTLAFDPGFQFSVMATLGLILLSPALESRLSFIPSAFLRDIVATTLAAQIFVLPILLWQSGNLSLVSLAANVLTTPVIPLAMLLSFLAGIVALIVPALASIAGFPAYLLLAYVIGIAEFGARLPLANVMLPVFPFTLVVFAYAGVFWLTARLSKPRVKENAFQQRPS